MDSDLLFEWVNFLSFVLHLSEIFIVIYVRITSVKRGQIRGDSII